MQFSQELTGSNSPHILVGVVRHVGDTARSGHYIAYVREPSTGLWEKCDDNTTSIVSWDEVSTQQAYMLFYSDPSTGGKDKEEAGRLKKEEAKQTIRLAVCVCGWVGWRVGGWVDVMRA